MISAEQLNQLLQTYQNQQPIFSPLLDKKTIALMQEESDFSFDFFAKMATSLEKEGNPDELLKDIKNYLAVRWSVLKKTNIAYTRHPFLPINQFFLKVAEAIAAPNEAVCWILMPTLRGLNRTTYSLKAETEHEGRFALEHFIINHDYTQLIPVEEIFQVAEVNSNAVIPDFQEDLTSLKYQLNTRDFVNLEQVAGTASQIYIRALKKHHAQQFDNHSIGFAIRRLANELKKGSVEDAGTEHFAEDKVISMAIVTFYHTWKKLPVSVKEKINSYRIQHYGNPHFNLESYFLALFVRHPDCPISEEDLKRVKREQIFPCAQQISDYLNEFLIQNKILYRIALNPHSDVEPSNENLPDLKALLNAALEDLQHRSQNIDGDDSELASAFPKFLLTFYYYQDDGPQYIRHIAAYLAPHINSYKDLNRLQIDFGLFEEVLAFISPKLHEFADIAHLKFFRKFPATQQRIILEAHLDELIKLHWSLKNFISLVEQLHNDEDKERLSERYSQLVAATINSYSDFVALQKTHELFINQIFTWLKPQYSLLFNNKKETLHILSMLSIRNQRVVLDYTSALWEKWVTPENYQETLRVLALEVRYGFNKIIAESITSKAANFDELLYHYAQWQSNEDMQSLLCNGFDPYLKAQGSDLNSKFQALLALTHKSLYWLIITKFSNCITSKELFVSCLPLVPKTCLALYVHFVPLGLFVKSLPELREIVALFPEEELLPAIGKKITANQIECTEEEFNLVIKPKHTSFPKPDQGPRLFKLPAEKPSAPLNLEHLVTDLKHYVDSSPGSRGLEIAVYLIEKLQKPTSIEEVIDLLTTQKRKIQNRYIFHGQDSLVTLFERHLKRIGELPDMYLGRSI